MALIGVLSVLVSILSAIILGLIGFFDYNTIEHLFGAHATFGSTVFFLFLTLFGIGGIFSGFYFDLLSNMASSVAGTNSITSPLFLNILLFITTAGAAYMGFAGLFHYSHLVSEHSTLGRIVYDLIGLSGITTLVLSIYLLITAKN